MVNGTSVSAATPLVKGSQLAEYPHETVVVVGKVQSVDQQLVTLTTDNDVQVKVLKNPGTSITSSYVLVKGVVMPDGPLREVKCYPFGDNFDMENYSSMVDLMKNPAFKSIFS